MLAKALLATALTLLLALHITAMAQEDTAGYWLKKGYELGANGSYEQALRAYEKVILIDPENAIAWNNKANTLYRLNRTSESNQAYYKALEITNKTLGADPGNVTLWLGKGLLLNNIGNAKEAVKAFDNANKIDPDNEMAWMMKGVLLATDLQRYDDAVKAFDNALRINPMEASVWDLKGDALRALGRQNEAEAAHVGAKEPGYSDLAPMQENAAEDWLKKGQELDRNGSHNESILAYNKALNLTNETLKRNLNDSEAWHTKGLVLQGLYRIDEAVDAFSRVIELDPRNAEAWLHNGKSLDLIAYRLQGQERTNAFADAIKAYDKAIEIDPDYGEAWANKGYSLGSLAAFNKNLSEYNESLKAFDKAVELIPTNDTWNLALAWDGRAITLTGMANTLDKNGLQEEAKGRREEAANDYSKAIELGPSFAGLEAQLYRASILADLGRYNESLAAYDNAIETKPANPPGSDPMYVAMLLTGKGDVLETMGDHEDALKAFDKAIELFPEYAEAWKGKGDALNDTGRYEDAVRAYDKAFEAGDLYSLSFKAMLWNGKGHALQAFGRCSEADASFAKAKELEALTVTVAQENTAEIWLKKGQELLKNNSFEESLGAFDNALRIDPENADVWQARGYALNLMSSTDPGKHEEARNNLEKALDLYNKTINQNPKDADIWLNKSFALRWLGKSEEALKAVNRSIELDPKNIDARGQKVELLTMLGRYNESNEVYDQAIAMMSAGSDRKLAEFLTFKGFNLLGQGNNQEALEAFEKVTELDPKEPMGWLYKGNALMAMGNYEDADKAYDEAAENADSNQILTVVWEARADALRTRGMFENAIKAYDRVLELSPRDQYAAVYLED